MKPHETYTILVSTKNQGQIEAISATLKTAGHNILQTTHADEALKLAAEAHPNLLILEHQIEETDKSLRSALRANRETSSIPILLLTQTAPINNTDQVDNLSPDDSLLVPFNDFQLIAKVTRLITRHQDQQILKRSELRYRDLVDNANDIVFTRDLEGNYTSINKAGRRITGYSEEEASSLHFAKIASSIDVQLGEKMLQDKLAGRASNTVYEISILAKDGRIIPIEVNTQLIYDEQGAPTGIQGIARDITARKQSEEALTLAYKHLKDANERANQQNHENSQRISNLAQTLSAARDLSTVFSSLVEFTISSVPCDTIVMALYNPERNEALPQFLWTHGGHVDLNEPQPIQIQTGPTGLAIISKDVIISNNLSSDSITKNSTSLNPQQNGHHPRLSIMTVPMTTTEKVVGILEIQTSEPGAYTADQKTPITTAANLAANAIENIRLIARDRDREHQLHQAQKLETIGRLAAGLAHDLNNSLTTIYGNCDMLAQGIDPAHELRLNVSAIKESAIRANLLTSQLLGFSRKQMLQYKTLDLNEIIKKSGDFMRMLLGDDILVDTNLDSDLPLAYVDQNHIEQILMNLAVNARDAMPTGGRITIETHRIPLPTGKGRRKRNPPEIRLTFSDTGIGMSDELQKQIFEPFFTTKPKGKGTGLGLSMVYGTIKQTGGNITVASEPDKGSTFIIEFPASKQIMPAQPDDAQHPEIHKGSQTILVAEDNQRVQETVVTALRGAGYSVLKADDGREALEIFKDSPALINMIITDLMMPEMNGTELATKAKALLPTLKVLYISGYSTEDMTSTGILHPGTAFISKPFNHTDLLRKVKEVFEETPTQAAATL